MPTFGGRIRSVAGNKMRCKLAAQLMLRLPDGDLPPDVLERLESHLAECSNCAALRRVVEIPRLLGRELSAPDPSPYFYRTVVAAIQAESQTLSIWQVTAGLARNLVLGIAAATLVFISVFTYLELRPTQADMYQAYDSIFMPGDRPSRMIIAEPGEITDESVLRALAEDLAQPPPQLPAPVPKRD